VARLFQGGPANVQQNAQAMMMQKMMESMMKGQPGANPFAGATRDSVHRKTLHQYRARDGGSHGNLLQNSSAKACLSARTLDSDFAQDLVPRHSCLWP
jgi:hypothetical protein